MPTSEKSSALPEAWVVPIRLGIYTVLAGCSAFIFFNVGDLVITNYLIIVSIVAVSAMVLLDCRVSDNYWKSKEGSNKTDMDIPSEDDNGGT